MPYFVLAKVTEKGKLYVKAHRRCNKAVDGVDVSLDADASKALIHESEERAKAVAKKLSEETLANYTVEPFKITPRTEPELALTVAPGENPTKAGASTKPTKAGK